MTTLTEMTDAEVELAIARWHEVQAETTKLRESGDRRAGYAGHPLVEEDHPIQARLAAEFGRRHGWLSSTTTTK